jgi:hypothetical protein
MSSKKRLTRSEIQHIFSTRAETYNSFISFFRYPQGIRAILQASDLLRPGLRVLDAGCGFGVVTFSLVEAMERRSLNYESIHAFDLTPAMLSRFQTSLDTRGITVVQLRQADVLALAELRKRLSPNGRILIVITKESPEAKILVEWWWRSESYSREELHQAFAAGGFCDVTFRLFPSRYFWLNRSSYAIEARPALSR